MTPEILGAIIQGGAIGLLAFVLWQVSLKIDTAMKNMQELMMRMIDIVAEARQEARQASIKSDRNYRAINEVKNN